MEERDLNQNFLKMLKNYSALKGFEGRFPYKQTVFIYSQQSGKCL